MKRITFFTRQDCELCEAAWFVIDKVRREIPFEWEKVDIAAPGNKTALERYGEHIPVVHLDGQEIFRHRVDERKLRDLLEDRKA